MFPYNMGDKSRTAMIGTYLANQNDGLLYDVTTLHLSPQDSDFAQTFTPDVYSQQWMIYLAHYVLIVMTILGAVKSLYAHSISA
jgi:hypothetical protein